MSNAEPFHQGGIGVREEIDFESEFVAEIFVGLDVIGADAEDGNSGFIEIGFAGGEGFALDGAAGRVVLGIEVDHEPLACEVAQLLNFAVLIGERERGERCAGGNHVVPICFIWDGSLFYSAIDQKPKRVAPTELARVKNIRRAPQVSLLVDYYDEDWTRLWYVLVHGEAGMVTDPAERTRAIQRLRAKYPQYDARMLADDSPVLRIVPARVTMRELIRHPSRRKSANDSGSLWAREEGRKSLPRSSIGCSSTNNTGR